MCSEGQVGGVFPKSRNIKKKKIKLWKSWIMKKPKKWLILFNLKSIKWTHIKPSNCIPSELNLDSGEHHGENMWGCKRGLEDNSSEMSSVVNRIRSPCVLLSLQLVVTGELTLHLASNITLKQKHTVETIKLGRRKTTFKFKFCFWQVQ